MQSAPHVSAHALKAVMPSAVGLDLSPPSRTLPPVPSSDNPGRRHVRRSRDWPAIGRGRGELGDPQVSWRQPERGFGATDAPVSRRCSRHSLAEQLLQMATAGRSTPPVAHG
jgi:hypothetical protein